MPEYQSITSLETELNQIFQKQDYYDPRKYLHREVPNPPIQEVVQPQPESQNSIVISSVSILVTLEGSNE